jgi:hypothetical protein
MSDFDHMRRIRIRSSHCRSVRRLGLEQLEPRFMLSVNVTTWHNDLTRQGLNSNETTLTPANVNSTTFGKLFSYPITGQVYAEPLYVSNLNMGASGTHNVAFVVTQNNDVYAFDAVNNGAGGGQLWTRHLGPAAAVPNAYFGNIGGPMSYGDITPQVGITSTPVIDLSTNTMYIDSFQNPSTGTYKHYIYALDITTGADKVARMEVAASIQGTSIDANSGHSGTLTFDPKQQLQRSALTLLNGVVYVAYAGYGDTPPYHGWILGFNATNLNLVKAFNDTPNATVPPDTREEGGGGIWQAGGGLVSDGTHLYFMTGNGDFDTSVGDYGDSFVELTPDSSTQPTNKNGYGLSVTDYFTPFNEQSLSDNDTDLGSAAPLLLPDQPGAHPHELVGAGKGLTMYLLDRDAMGGHNTSNDLNAVQTVSVSRAPGSQAYFNNLVYFHGYNNAFLKAYQLQSDGKLSVAAVGTGAAQFGFPGATPAISSYGNSANGIVWEIERSASTSPNVALPNAVLRAYDAVPSSGNLNEIYNSNLIVARDQLGPPVKFNVPTVADGHVYVGTDGALTVFGLLTNPSTAPAAPTNLTATISALQGLKVKLNWTDNANNESAFKIERSTDGTNYTQLAIASVNSSSYADTSVVSGTTYYYRVSATNPIGDSSAVSIGPIGPDFTQLYKFDEGTGTFAADTGSTGANTGVLVGTTQPAWVSGRIGAGALSFSGTGAYNQTKQSAVQVTTNLMNPLGKTSTLTAWVKTTQTGSNNHQQAPAITGVDQQGTTGDINWGTLNASGQIGIYVGDTGGVYSTSPINDGNWHNVAMTRDSTTGVVQLYIDGVLNGSSTLDTGIKAAQFYLIGALTDRNSSGNVTGANYFNGQLDDVRIYNRVLSAAEISQIGSAPGAGADLSAAPIPDTNSMMELSWTNPSDIAQTFQLERKTGVNGTYQQIATLDGTQTQYFDTNLEEGTQYFYRLQASDTAGTSGYSNEASATTLMPQILGRFVFYNQSSFDGRNGTSNIIDGPARALDKVPLLPGQTATFQNYTSYSKGINGIMVDVANFEGSISEDDWIIRVGNSSDVSTWAPAPEPDFVTEFLGSGVNGSIRLEVGWDNNQIQNEWVQFTLKANANTGLAADDVFYFGNAIGDTGNSATDATVDAADELATQTHHTSAAAITNVYDFNRDKVVDATDEAIAHDHFSGGSPLQLITVPANAGASLQNGNLGDASDSMAGIRTESAPIETPATPGSAMVSPLNLLSTSVVRSRAREGAKSVDAVFADFERAPIHGDFAASLLTMETVRLGNRRKSMDGSGTDHSHIAASCNDTNDAADETIANEFGPTRSGRFKFFTTRL